MEGSNKRAPEDEAFEKAGRPGPAVVVVLLIVSVAVVALIYAMVR
jgi:hypothetical protein